MFRIFFVGLWVAIVSSAHADPVKSIEYFEQGLSSSFDSQGEATPDTPFTLASVGKAMTAVAILRLVDRGLLDLEQSVAELVSPGIARGIVDLDQIEVWHLLTMTSGLPDYYADAYVTAALKDREANQNPRVALSFIFGYEPYFSPGQSYDYSNSNYVLLQLILEHVTGTSYAAVMDQEVFGPAGMRSAFVFGSKPLPNDFPYGHEGADHVRDYYQGGGFGDGGVIASARDLAKFYKALLLDQTLVSDESLEAMLEDPLDEGYGMGIDVADPIYGHSGGDLGFATDVRVNVETRAIAVTLNADSDAEIDWAYEVVSP